MQYTKDNIHAGFEFTNDSGKGKIYKVKDINPDTTTCHLVGVTTFHNNDKYPINKIVELVNSGTYVPLTSTKIENYAIY